MTGMDHPPDENLSIPHVSQGKTQLRVSSNAASAGDNTRDSALPHLPQVLDWV